MRLPDKIRDVVTVVAPTLGLALGGPLGGLAGQMIATALGGQDQRAVEAQILQQSPETLLALKKTEEEFLVKLRELDIQENQLEVQDRSSARELAKTSMKPHIYLTALFLTGYFGLLALFAAGMIKVPVDYKDVFVALIGVLTANVPTLIGFWFGSSQGSMQKSELLAVANGSK